MPDIYVAPHHKESKKTTNAKEVVLPNIVSKPGPHYMLSSFVVRPRGVRFETQEHTEEVVLLLRRHFITNVPWIIGVIILIFAPFIAVPILTTLLENTLSFISSAWMGILTLFWYLVTLGFLLFNFLDWYFNVYIITDRRIVDVDLIALLYKEISSAELDKIEDVTYRQGGAWLTFFNYGDVLIQTAGTHPNFEFSAVANPNKVISVITQLIEQIP